MKPSLPAGPAQQRLLAPLTARAPALLARRPRRTCGPMVLGTL
jgi:hypothetical protein